MTLEKSLISFEDFEESHEAGSENFQFWVKSDDATIVFDWDRGSDKSVISLKIIGGWPTEDGVEAYGMPIDGLIAFLNMIKSQEKI